MDSKITAAIALACGLALGFVGGKVSNGSNHSEDAMQTVQNENSSVKSSRRIRGGEEGDVSPMRPFRGSKRIDAKKPRSERLEDRSGRKGGDRHRERRRRPADDPSAIYKYALGNAPMTGAASAKVTIVEVSDYQCPFCAKGNTTMDAILAKYPDTVRIAMKQNPLSFHKFARGAANAALAAGEQGKYWEMHAKLFEATAAKRELNVDYIVEMASELGLSADAIRSAVESDKFGSQIDADMKQAASLGLRGTPAFLINGRKLSGAQPIERFAAVIDEELKRADEALAAGAPADANALYEFLTKDGAEKLVMLPGQENAEPEINPFMGTGPAQDVSIPATSPAMGPADAKVTLIEFLDFQCPHCRTAAGDVQQIAAAYPADLRVIFRHKPLTFHQQARTAALASMAAHKQGKFWEMEAKLFALGKELSEETITNAAQEIGLDMGAFLTDWKSDETAQLVDADIAEALKLGVRGTPTMFINGRMLIGARDQASLTRLIDDEIAKVKDGAAK